jgi:hypothetical protein
LAVIKGLKFGVAAKKGAEFRWLHAGGKRKSPNQNDGKMLGVFCWRARRNLFVQRVFIL